MAQKGVATTSASKSLKEQKDLSNWPLLLAGGLASSGAFAWCLYRSFNLQQSGDNDMVALASFLAGGIGGAVFCKVCFNMGSKSTDYMEKSTFSKDIQNFITRDNKDPNNERYGKTGKVKEIYKVKEQDLSKGSSVEQIQAAQVPFRKEAPCSITRDNEDPNNERSGKTEKVKEIHNVIEQDFFKGSSATPIQEAAKVHFVSDYVTRYSKTSCSDEMMVSRKAKLKQVVLSHLNELKGYVQGTIDPLPSARNNCFGTIEMSNEARQYTVMIINEFTNGVLIRIEQSIDEFFNSVCKADQVHHYGKDRKIKTGEKDQRTEDKDRKIKTGENDQRTEDALEVSNEPLESPQRGEKITTKASEFSPPMEKAASPNSRSEDEPKHPEADIASSSSSNPSRKSSPKDEKNLSRLNSEIIDYGINPLVHGIFI